MLYYKLDLYERIVMDTQLELLQASLKTWEDAHHAAHLAIIIILKSIGLKVTDLEYIDSANLHNRRIVLYRQGVSIAAGRRGIHRNLREIIKNDERFPIIGLKIDYDLIVVGLQD